MTPAAREFPGRNEDALTALLDTVDHCASADLEPATARRHFERIVEVSGEWLRRPELALAIVRLLAAKPFLVILRLSGHEDVAERRVEYLADGHVAVPAQFVSGQLAADSAAAAVACS